MKTTDAFWDSSALVPLCVEQSTTVLSRAARRNGSIAVWWATPVEITSALERLLRNGELESKGHDSALVRLEALRGMWIEVAPSGTVRDLSEALLRLHPLRAADALQLSAALIWCKHHPRGRIFTCFDGRLAEAAAAEGFDVLTI